MNGILLFKATALLLATLAGAHLLRPTPAGARHRFWSGVFVALLGLPLIAPLMPVVMIPLPIRWASAMSVQRPVGDRFTGSLDAGDQQVGPPVTREGAKVATILPDRVSGAGNWSGPLTGARGAGRWATARRVLRAMWLTGALAAAGALIVSLWRVRRLARCADAVIDAGWCRAANEIARRLGLQRPARLLSSPVVTTPMAGGLLRPTIFLPSSAWTWSAEQRDIVLAHEIAHLVARDPLRHLVGRLAMACYWFHPCAWIAARQAAIAREQACDEAVLSLGTRPSAYARVLLDLADALPAGAPLGGALPMVEPSVLEKRLMAILNDDVRPMTRRTLLAPAVSVAFLTLTLSAAQPTILSPPETVPYAARRATETPTALMSSAQPTAVKTAREATLAPATGLTILAQSVERDSACAWNATGSGSFSGSISMSDRGGRSVIQEQVGSNGVDRVVQKSFGDLRVCMLAEGVGGFDAGGRPSLWIDRARRMVLETHLGGKAQQLDVVAQPGGGRRTTWRVGGLDRPFDQTAQQWRTQMLAVLDATWELSMLRGEVSSLRGEISSIHGQRSSHHGEISSLRGEVSSMRGHISSVRGEESSLRGEISSIRGHVSSLRGAISSERGAISSLNADRYWSDRSDRDRHAGRIAEHEKEIARLEQAIRDYHEDARVAAVEKEIAALGADRKIAEIEARIKAFDLEGKIAAIERRIAALDVDGRVAGIERQIGALDADRRGRQLEDRRDTEIRRLEAAIAAIR